MRLTIIPSDKVIIIDGVAVHLDIDGATQFPTTDSNIHAIQWYENKGSKQKVDNSELEWFDDKNILNDYIAAHETEIKRLEALEK
tara:strand:+ start:479 stop:733 length:255 start_codon:yes stop_codon:yes gene_type:complete